jgi:hypothetical protein
VWLTYFELQGLLKPCIPRKRSKLVKHQQIKYISNPGRKNILGLGGTETSGIMIPSHSVTNGKTSTRVTKRVLILQIGYFRTGSFLSGKQTPLHTQSGIV